MSDLVLNHTMLHYVQNYKKFKILKFQHIRHSRPLIEKEPIVGHVITFPGVHGEAGGQWWHSEVVPGDRKWLRK